MAPLSRTRKTGLPPGTPVYTGLHHDVPVVLSVIDYNEQHCDEKILAGVAQAIPYRDSASVSWINIEGLHRTDLIAQFGERFALHPLVLEDIVHTEQRPKLDDFEEYLYIVVRMLDYDTTQQTITTEQVSIILGKNFVLTFQEKPGDVFETIRTRIRTAKGRIRKMGADYLAYCLLDAIVDHYFLVLERLSLRMEQLEEELLDAASSNTLHALHLLKRELVWLRKSVWPLREVIGTLQRGDSALVCPTTQLFLRDLYDHTIQVIEGLETYRDLLAGMLDVALSTLSLKMNQVMKVLTIITTIFIPLSFIAGIYGMNFQYMPELQSHWGYPLTLATMGLIGAAMLAVFRRQRWL